MHARIGTGLRSRWLLLRNRDNLDEAQDVKRLYKRRRETVERSFADAKELHGHRYARFRGVVKVRAQALLAGACQSMKKMARLLARAAARLLHAFQLPEEGAQAVSDSFVRSRWRIVAAIGNSARLSQIRKNKPPPS
ncbi:transposase [Thiobacillus sp.]|uniref:transposase n=1 Tax=Thiobacillus sp. TaxID=924 RepID=UPI0025D9F7FC|nr:transposase [Thiobacillus sp.]